MATKVQIRGLNGGLTMADMEQSRLLYNGLPSDENQREVGDRLLQQLAKIFVDNKAHEVFGVHLIHSHLQIPEQRVLFGDETVPRCRWTKPTTTDSLKLDEIHGHTFILTDNVFHPYEYHSGKHPGMTQVGDNFLTDLANFLNTNGLGRVIALEVLDSPLPKAMMELVLGVHGTMLIESSRLKGCKPYRQTGWAFTNQDGKPRVCDDGKEYHAVGPQGHIIAKSPRDKIESLDDALNFLTSHGLIK